MGRTNSEEPIGSASELTSLGERDSCPRPSHAPEPSLAKTESEPQPESGEVVIKGLRASVREEVRRLNTPQPPPSAKWPDVLWASVLLANLALLISIVPAEWLKDERWQLLIHIAPWIFSVLLLADWFRAWMQAISQNRRWRFIQAIALMLLTLFSRLPIFNFRVHIEPSDAQLFIDNEEVDWHKRIWEPYGSYTLVLRHQAGAERQFLMTPSRLFNSSWRPNSDIELDLVFEACVSPYQPGTKWRIRRRRGVFDEDFPKRTVITDDEMKRGLQKVDSTTLTQIN
jgi:hypothetical protein